MPRLNAPSDNNETLTALPDRRLRQMTWLVIAALLAAVVPAFLREAYVEVILLLVPALLLGLVFWFVRLKQLALARYSLIFVSTAFLLLQPWAGAGLRGVGWIALAGLPMLVILVGDRKLVWPVTALLIVNVWAMGYAEHAGLINFPIRSYGFSNAATMTVALVAMAWLAFVLSSDYRQLYQQLRSQYSQAMRAKADAEYLATRDSLTGLPNREAAREHFEACLAEARQLGQRTAVIFLDLDHFKEINDSLGHPMGDRILISLSNRLQQVLRPGDMLCRFGGDEFLVIPSPSASQAVIQSLAELVKRNLEQQLQLDGYQFQIECTIGIAIASESHHDFDELLKHADIAMFHAKHHGRGTIKEYDQALEDVTFNRYRLMTELRSALANQQFTLHYQPIVDLTSGQCCGAEALLRWYHPQLGAITPDVFIPIAEATGLIVELGDWVIRQALYDCVQLKEQVSGPFRMAINISALQMQRPEFHQRLLSTLTDQGLEASDIELEITESVLIDDSPYFIEAMDALQQAGVSFSIDDFGTGYSNLGYLRRFKITTLKIDKSFIHSLTSDEDNCIIVNAITHLAHGLGMKIVAEGIDDPRQIPILQSLGVQYAQGFHWSRALEIEDFIDYLHYALRTDA